MIVLVLSICGETEIFDVSEDILPKMGECPSSFSSVAQVLQGLFEEKNVCMKEKKGYRS